MKRRKQLLLVLFTVLVLLVSACGEKTTVIQMTADEEAAAKLEDNLELISLKIVGFAFDSTDPESAVTVRWEADGDFDEGFMVAWSPNSPVPKPGIDSWVPVADSSAREVEVKLSDNVAHYFRVCHVTDGECDRYSETVQVVFPDASLSDSDTEEEFDEKTATPTAVLTPTLEATDLPEMQIQIDSITTSETGIVTVAWEVLSGSAPLGFRVNWSNSNENPTSANESAHISSSDTRNYPIEGFGRGNTYYFSVCQATEDGCGAISSSVAYKVPLAATATPIPTSTPEPEGIVLTSLVETSAGQVKVSWTADGYFPKGFKIVWSASSSSPVYPGDNYAAVDSTARSGYIKNLTAGKTYYFRVCRYNGSSCDLYSNMKSITLSSATVTESIKLESISDAGCGAVKLIWSATGDFPNGFKIAYSSSNTEPVFPGDSYEYVSNGDARSVIIDGLTEGSTYYFRVCKYDGSGCTLYSNMKQYTVPCTEATKTPTPVPTADASTITLKPIVDEGSGSVTVLWVATGSFPSGFKIVWSEVHDSPVYPGDAYYHETSPTATSVYLSGYSSGSTYYFRVCRYTGSGCDIYSGVQSITLP